MDLHIRETLINVAFQRLNLTLLKCRLCSCVFFNVCDRRSIFLHIQLWHPALWHVALFLPNSISPQVWLSLYRHPTDARGFIIPDSVQCRLCNDMFNFIYPADLPALLNHIKGAHPCSLLDLSLLHTPLD